jgi:hypothetical protein
MLSILTFQGPFLSSSSGNNNEVYLRVCCEKKNKVYPRTGHEDIEGE